MNNGEGRNFTLLFMNNIYFIDNLKECTPLQEMALLVMHNKVWEFKGQYKPIVTI